MKAKAILLWAAFVVLLLGPAAANAAITCTTITSGGVSINYVTNTTVALQTTFTVTCSRSSTSDATSISYDVRVNDGLQNNGINNNARLGTDDIRYDLYTSACNGQKWKGTKEISDTITWASGQTGAISKSTTFWACINTAQAPTTSGGHTDTITMTATYNAGAGVQTITGSIGVVIYAPAVCTVPVGFGPGTISLAYTSFSPSPVSATTTFRVNCTIGMPYTMDVSPTSGTLAGIDYTVSVPASSTGLGTGTSRTHTITADAVANQAGTCTNATCTPAAAVHTLTITY